MPVPASVYGLVLLLAALNFKLVKLDDVKEVGTYLTGIFPLLFVPAAAGVMELWAEMGEMLLPILVAIIPVTVLVMVSAGKTTQALTGRKKKEADNDAGSVSFFVRLRSMGRSAYAGRVCTGHPYQ